MQKLNRDKTSNSGNTFIVIMVTLACMGILIGVILASVGYYYRSIYTDLENRNNFYYVEKAIDEIYAGVGNDSISALINAYSDTVEVMVYYEDGRYVRIDTAEANKIMKQKFLQKMANDENYYSQQKLYEHLQSFITESDITLVDPATLAATEPRLYMEIVTTTTGVGASAITTYEKLVIHNVTVTRTTDEGYVQSITTDIEITEPEFDVSFSGVDSATNALYDFTMIADMGVEFDSATSENQVVSLTGNVYAASDYYNKEYNVDSDTRVSSYYSGDAASVAKLATCNGINDTSKYSGLYINNSRVSIMAEKVIVPGSISIINEGDASIMGNAASGSGLAEVWADNIVLAGSSVRTVGTKVDGGSLSMYATAYISDDLEINNNDADLEFSGNYYGYNYSQTDDLDRVLSEYAESAYVSGAYTKGHYNSSAIIVNGNNAKVDFSDLSNLYVAGRAYIETSRISTSTVSDDGKTATVSYVEVEGNSDVQTGESISVKSNQVAYMPSVDSTGRPIFTSFTAFNDKIIDVIVTEKGWVNASQMTVSYEISGRTYSFLNFVDATASAEFFEWYANVLPTLEGYDEATDLVDVKSYSNFDVAGIDIGEGTNATTVTTSGAYTTGALNVAQNKALTITSKADLFGSGSAITNFNQTARTYNNNYMEMKYALQTISLGDYSGDMLTNMTNMKDEIANADGSEVTPINTFLNFSKVSGKNLNATKIGNYYVWIVDGDVTITAPSGSNGKIMGLIIATGDVNFTDESVTRFEGLIVSGSKIKVNHAMDFVANAEIVKTILRTADATKENTVGNYSVICEIFKDYNPDSEGSSDTGASVGNIEIGDVIQYENWKKNVE